MGHIASARTCLATWPFLILKLYFRVRVKSQLRFRRRQGPGLDLGTFADERDIRPVEGEVKKSKLDADDMKFEKFRDSFERRVQKVQRQSIAPVFNETDTYSASPAGETKRSMERETNLDESNAEWDDKEHQYFIGKTRIPDHLEHWLTDPMGLKTSRDRKLVRKLRAMQLKDERAKKALKGNKRESGGVVTQRMARIQAMLLREMNTVLTDLPTMLGSGGPTAFAPDETHSSIIHSAFVHITRTEVTRDLLQARFFWDCIPGQRPAVERELRRLTPQLRYLLQQQVKMKYAPMVHFMVDAPNLQEADVERRLDVVEDELSKSGLLLSDDRIDRADASRPRPARTMAPKGASARRNEDEEEEEEEEEQDGDAEVAATPAEPFEGLQYEEEPAPKPKKPRIFLGPQKPFDFRDKSRQILDTHDGRTARSRRYL